MRLLGVDFGFARIGLAVGEAEFGIISPRPALSASGTLKKDAHAIRDVFIREEVSLVVLGLPIEESGNEGKMARIVRSLASQLKELGVEVALVDETLTSVTAEKTLREEGLKASQRRRRKDGEAASLILERYLDGQKTD